MGDAPTEELFTRRTMPRSHRRPEPLRKATLRVLAAVLVAGGSVDLTMNLTSGDGGKPAAAARAEDRSLQRVDGPVMPRLGEPFPTDAQTTDGQTSSAAIGGPLAPATTRKATTVKPTTAPPVVAPARPRRPVTPTPTTVPTTVPTTPPTTDPAPTPTPEPSASPAPPASSEPASSQPTP